MVCEFLSDGEDCAVGGDGGEVHLDTKKDRFADDKCDEHDGGVNDGGGAN